MEDERFLLRIEPIESFQRFFLNVGVHFSWNQLVLMGYLLCVKKCILTKNSGNIRLSTHIYAYLNTNEIIH